MEEIIRLGDVEALKEEYSKNTMDEFGTIDLAKKAFEYNQLEIFKFMLSLIEFMGMYDHEDIYKKRLEIIHLVSNNVQYLDELIQSVGYLRWPFLIIGYFREYGCDRTFISHILENDNISADSKGRFIFLLLQEDGDLDLATWCLDHYYFYCEKHAIEGQMRLTGYYSIMKLPKFILLIQCATNKMMDHIIDRCIEERATEKLKYLVENNLVGKICMDEHLKSFMCCYQEDAKAFKEILELFIANGIEMSLSEKIENDLFWEIVKIVDMMRDYGLF